MKKKLLFLSALTLLGWSVSAQVTYNVTVPDGTNSCFISGDMNGWTFTEMTKVDATHYTITIAAATTSQGYKYLSGPSWSYEERFANGSWRGNRTYSTSDIVEKWLAVYVPAAPKINITIRARTPWNPTYIHFWGDAASDWPGMVMTQVGDWWEYTFTNVTTMNFIFNNNGGSQTADILTVTANKCYQVNSDNSFTVVDCSTFSAVNETKANMVELISENSVLSVSLEGKATASVYTLHGALVSVAEFENYHVFSDLKKGMYLVKVNGKTFKAIVK